MVGGKGLDATLWSLERREKVWQAKNTRPDALGLQTPIWVTKLLLLGGDENRVLAATGELYQWFSFGLAVVSHYALLTHCSKSLFGLRNEGLY